MSYGLAIPTTIGVTTLENVRSLQEVYRATKTTASGSQAIPSGAVEANSAVFFEINDGGSPPSISWSGSTLTWTSQPAGLSPTSNFDLIVCRFK
jgi:hypothetical protein